MVAEGYKQTEIGVIPEDWDFVKFKKVCKLINGRGFKPHEWQKDGLAIIRIQNLNGSDEYNYFQGIYDKKLEVENGQLLFAWSGSKGTSFGPHIWHGNKALLNYHTWKVVVDTKTINSNYFFHALKRLTKTIEDKAHGASALVHTQKGEMENFLISIPPKQEQKAIAQALSDIDALIASLEKFIAKKEHIKTATMQQLLTGRKRLDGFSEEWEEKTLGELFEFRNGLNKAKEFFGYGTPIVNYMDVFSFYGLKKENILGKVQVTNNEIKSYRVKKGDVFFTRTSETVDEIGLTTVILEDLENTVFSGFILRARPIIDVYELEFKKYCFSGETIRKQIMATSSYTTRALTNGSSLKKVVVSIPPKKEQKAIAQILSDMDNEIETLKTKLKKTKNVKIGMMQELLTGKTRLKEKGE